MGPLDALRGHFHSSASGRPAARVSLAVTPSRQGATPDAHSQDARRTRGAGRGRRGRCRCLAAGPAYAAGRRRSRSCTASPASPVDVYVNGKKTLDNFKPATVAGPLDLAAGKYDIVLIKPGDPVEQPDPQGRPGRGARRTRTSRLVAHLTADGKPALTPFVNDVSQGRRRQGPARSSGTPRRRPRSTCAPVAARVQGPHQPERGQGRHRRRHRQRRRRPGRHPTVAIGPADLTLAEGTATIVYAVGSAEGKTLGVVAQKIDGLHSTPGGVPSRHRWAGRHGAPPLVVRAWPGRRCVAGRRLPARVADRRVRRLMPVPPRGRARGRRPRGAPWHARTNGGAARLAGAGDRGAERRPAGRAASQPLRAPATRRGAGAGRRAAGGAAGSSRPG